MIPLVWSIDSASATIMIDPTADEGQKARDALGNVNVQDANQLGELIGHLYLKMSEHSTSATAHINTHADDILALSHKLNKFVADADAQFQDIHRLTNACLLYTSPSPRD